MNEKPDSIEEGNNNIPPIEAGGLKKKEQNSSIL